VTGRTCHIRNILRCGTLYHKPAVLYGEGCGSAALKLLLTLLPGFEKLLRTGGTPWELLGELFRKGVQEAEQKSDGWEAAVMGNTITLLTMIKRATDDRSAQMLKAEKSELLDRTIAYLEKNYSKSVTIGDLAKEFYISSSTVSHLFKKKLGVSFYRYVTQRRLIAAKSLIEQGHLLEQVASQVGFQDYSSFYRAFKQEYGISPRQYRSLHTASAP